MNLNEILTDLILDANDFNEAHALPIAEHLQAADVASEHAAALEHTWQRALRTHQDVLERLQGTDHEDDPTPGGRKKRRVATRAELAQLTDEELVEAIDACEASLHDCQDAVATLAAREAGAQADFWFGEDAPVEWFRQLADWFESALVVLRRLRQWRALADNREATQFQPLDPTSPSVLVQVRVPQNLLERLDAALAGRPRSDAIREAITAWLGEEDAGSTALVPHIPRESGK